MAESKTNQDKQFDLVVIGAGPGGYVAAIRAAQLGFKVACVDREKQLGGTCLRIGCIPSKALLESSELYWAAQKDFGDHGIGIKEAALDLAKMQERKEQIVEKLTGGVRLLFKKNKVEPVTGTARIESPNKVIVEGEEGARTLETKRILIATGSVSATVPGIEFDGDRIDSSTEALAYTEVPEHLIVIGAGYIGLEMGSVWHRLGAKVTVLEYLDRILPGMDAEIAREAHRVLKRQGLEFKLGSRVTGAKVKGKQVEVSIDGADALKADRVLVAVGRRPSIDGLGLEEIGVKIDDRGRIDVDDHYRTSVEGIFAVGDVIRGPMLAHKASDEGIACVERMATGYGHVNYDAIPGICYTHPEIASVGRTEEELKEAGVEYRKGMFPFSANGRAMGIGETSGRVKILADAKTDRVVGVHILGARAGELIAEVTAAIEFGASSEDIARTVHGHPTLAEAVREAALAVDGRAIHI